jgi:DNA-directed RNA polymerase subunit RPC12/RpoP
MSSDRNERKRRMRDPLSQIPKRKRRVYRIVERGTITCEKCGGRLTIRKREQRASGGGRPTTIAETLYRCLDCGDTFKGNRGRDW